MKEESAQSTLNVSKTDAVGTPEVTAEVSNRLSQDEVINRLFAPDQFLPQPRNEKAIVLVTEGGVERGVTHLEVETLIAHGADQLRKRGVKADDNVVFYCDNSPELTATVLSCWSLNSMAALIDYRAERPAVLAICKKLNAKLLVTAKRLYKDFALETKYFAEAGLEVLDVADLADSKDTAPKTQVDIKAIDLDRPAFTILTSGTTGNPKTSVHTLRSLVVNIIDLAEAANQHGSITALTPLPLSHVFGLTVFLIAQVLGAKTVLTQLEPVGFIKAVHRHKPDWIAALPQFYGAMLSAPNGFIKLDNAKLLLCGGAPLTVSLADKFQETFGKQLNNGYGSTECKLVAFNRDGGATLSAGTPVGDIKIEIVNEQGEVLPEGEIGEVRIAGPMLMEKYLDNEDETRKAIRSGWYYTGDIGRFEGGHLFVVGRKDDVVVVGGVVVRSGIVEEALRNNPQVKDVAVTAVGNRRLGQIVKASIVLVDDKVGEKLMSTKREVRLETERELQRAFKAFCKDRLTRFQRPMKWEFLGPHDDLPKTLAGKTDKKKLSAAKSA
ncbi:MAG TPA: class I adenylate-forming enzyme family protein [Drouetiella sp.]